MGVMCTRAMPDCQSGDFNVETHAYLRDEVNQGNKRALTQLAPIRHMSNTDLATAPAYTPHPRLPSNTGLHITEYRDNLHRLTCPYQKSYQLPYTHVRQHFENAIAGRNLCWAANRWYGLCPSMRCFFPNTSCPPLGCVLRLLAIAGRGETGNKKDLRQIVARCTCALAGPGTQQNL